MTKQLLSTIAALGLAVSVSANAAAMKSEFFYQTEADKNQVTPELMYSSQSLKFKSTSTNKWESTNTTLRVSYERGINEMLSAGARLPFTTATLDKKTTASDKTETSGIGDLTFFLKGNYSIMDGQALWFGTDLVFSPGDHTSKRKSATKTEDNNYAGGHSLNPYVGWSMMAGSFVVGAKLSTELGIGDRTSKDTTTVGGTAVKNKRSGGHTTALTLFGEMPITNGNVGAKLVYAGMNTTTVKPPTGASSKVSGLTSLGLGVYGNYDVTPTIAVIGGLDYTKVTSGTAYSQTLDSGSGLALNVGGRFTF